MERGKPGINDANDCLWNAKGMVLGKYTLNGWLNAQAGSPRFCQTHLAICAFWPRTDVFNSSLSGQDPRHSERDEVLRGKLPDLAMKGLPMNRLKPSATFVTAICN